MQDLESLRASLPDYEDASRLHRKLEQLGARTAELEVQNAQLRQQLSEMQRTMHLWDGDGAFWPAAADAPDGVKEFPVTLHLGDKKSCAWAGATAVWRMTGK